MLSEYEFEIVHRPCANNVVPDYMSRHPVETDPTTGICIYIAQRHAINSEACAPACACIAAAFAHGVAQSAIVAVETHPRDIWASHDGMQYVRGELTERDVTPE